jgi:serine/threonine protein kinase
MCQARHTHGSTAQRRALLAATAPVTPTPRPPPPRLPRLLAFPAKKIRADRVALQEYCNGGSLQDALAARQLVPPTLTARWRPILHILSGVAEGLAYMHNARVCHGDLHPANVLFKVCSASPGRPL